MDNTYKNYMVVDYKPGEDSQIKYNAHKRRRLKTVTEDEVDSNSATLVPQLYRDEDGKLQTRMVPSKKDVIDNDKNKDGSVKEEVEIDEALSINQRRKKALQMKKNKARIMLGRKKASKKIANLSRIKKRAQRQARQQMFKRLSKGVGKKDLTLSKRREIEQRVDKLKPRVNRLAKRLVNKVRKAEIDRKR